MAYEIRDVVPGLWIWRIEHPAWAPERGWEPLVTSTCVESGGEIAVLDPLAPPDDLTEVWERLNARPPSVAVVLKPDHVSRCRPLLRGDAPETDLEWIGEGAELPGGILADHFGSSDGSRAVQGRHVTAAARLARPAPQSSSFPRG